MATIPAFGARNLPATYYPATQKADGKTANTAANTSTNTAAPQKAGSASSPLSLSTDALDMQKRVASLGTATVDFAESFVNSFTQALFGDDAKGASIEFDSASLESSSSYAMGTVQTSGANGVSSLAGFSLTDSSHFIGKGTITTADGRKFDFEVEVKYDARLDAVAGQASNQTDATDAAGDSAQAVDLSKLPTVQLPNIDFPGTLSDLFELIGRDLQTALANNDTTPNNGDDAAGTIDRNTLRNLSLRLLTLVDNKDVNTYTGGTAADKAKTAAAYGEQATSAQPSTVPEADADAPATLAATEAAAAAPLAEEAAAAAPAVVNDPSRPDPAS